MKILAIDTSTEYCSVALYLDGCIQKIEIEAGYRHSELLLPTIHELLQQAKLALLDIDGIAFGAGPGSFTGLRIACGVTQGLAFAANLPIIGISTLKAIAQQNTQHSHIITALDARMGEIYHAAYIRQNSNWHPINEPVLCQPQHAPALPDSAWIGCGSGFDVYSPELSKRYGHSLAQINYGCRPRAQEIAHLAASCPIEEFHTDPAQATPIYIRNKVALKESER